MPQNKSQLVTFTIGCSKSQFKNYHNHNSNFIERKFKIRIAF
jgi:hypothetical protein